MSRGFHVKTMPIRFEIEHHSAYHYGQGIALNYGEAHLLPREFAGQKVVTSRLEIAPAATEYRERLDAWGNRVVWFMLRQSHQTLRVSARSVVEREAVPARGHATPWEAVARQLLTPMHDAECVEAREFCLDSPMIPSHAAATDYARASFPRGRPLLDGVADLSRRIHADFNYTPLATRIDTPLDDVLKHRHGVCQDFAHLALAGLRGLGLAARYVSGYLETTPPPGQERLEGADASHAWIAVFLPQVGWFDFDPTNGCATGLSHLTVAWGRDYADVAPLKGVIYGGGVHDLDVAVTVRRLG